MSSEPRRQKLQFQMRVTFIQAFQVMFLNTYQHLCGTIYRQHHSPDYFQSQFEEVNLEKWSQPIKPFTSRGILQYRLTQMWNISNESRRFAVSAKLLSHSNCWPTHACLYSVCSRPIDNTSVNNSDKFIASGNISYLILAHRFSQFCITTSARDKKQQIKSVN